MDTFDSASAFKHAQAIAYPRLVGTEGELRAAGYIKEQLEQYGYTVAEEEFNIAYTPWGFSRFFLMSALILLGFSWLSYESLPWLAFVLLSILLFVQPVSKKIWLKLAQKVSEDKREPEKRLSSKNIIAGQPEAADKPRTTVYLIAHYDSKSQTVSLPVRIFCLVLAMGAVFLLLVGLGLQHCNLFCNFLLDIKYDLWFTVAVLSVLRLLMVSTQNKSSGGLDNAGSVGVVLELARMFSRHCPAGIEIKCLFTGAEEYGLLGASQYAAGHLNEWRRENTYFINLDGVGIEKKLVLLGQKDPELTDEIVKLAHRQHIKLGRRGLLPGLLVDHIPFAENGFPAVTLACAASKSLLIHTRYDNISLLDKAGLEEVGALTATWIQSLAQRS